MVLHDDVIREILPWLPVVALLRFKCVCRSWRALIESSKFIKQHLHLHHYDPIWRDKNRNLIYELHGNFTSVTFPLTSIDSFEEPKVCLQLNCYDLHGFFRMELVNIVSYNGIICLNLVNRERECCIYLWNPATKQSRVLPQSTFHDKRRVSVGFGYDIKSNDYKVVKLITGKTFAGKRVYSLNTGCWRRLASDFSFSNVDGHIRVPFNNGTCFFWGCVSSKNECILCFDFSSETFRRLSLPPADCHPLLHHKCVVNDKIACLYSMSNHHTEMWVFNEYGTINESWTKLWKISTYSFGRQYPIVWVSTNGKYIFFTNWVRMCRFNVVTKEVDGFSLVNMYCSLMESLVEFKESLVSI